ncbi:glucan 1,3-beta-glucosidase [Caldanaerobius fijiensis DSM 17918]|uniref:Exo-1,3-beta-glucanase D n=1 Tax=Caldanaerobius fijiensis DSM 17918 TaxID=1121256 RepID=A0A1M5EDY9_9THEO|nr:glycoside hydrolase family 5 protein [Caldanaerobius fijiensis]SHF77449.1 glucan 1,3-beta-glucosidase [Caldanaerobius fijiensis DSM 17918]
MNKEKKIRGVNLGGWLVLEKWMTPSLFEGLKAVDETTFCQELGPKAEERLRKHWETFITEEDFKWLANVDINAVRIPVGHWIFGDTKPYVGAIDVLDWAVKTASRYGIGVLLDLHAAPGCQNGFDNGGIMGVMEWHKHPENVARSLDVIERLAQRYAVYDNVIGVELLNEPRWDVPEDILKDYYIRGYERVRKHMNEDVAVVIHDGFRPLIWDGFMSEPEFSNVILDTHMYQCFTDEDKNKDVLGHVEKALKRKEELYEIGRQLPTYVGEWSLGLDGNSLRGLSTFQKEAAMRAFGSSQLLGYENAAGWFFWSYKIEVDSNNEWKCQWDFRECVKRGWLPHRYI